MSRRLLQEVPVRGQNPRQNPMQPQQPSRPLSPSEQREMQRRQQEAMLSDVLGQTRAEADRQRVMEEEMMRRQFMAEMGHVDPRSRQGQGYDPRYAQQQDPRFQQPQERFQQPVDPRYAQQPQINERMRAEQASLSQQFQDPYYDPRAAQYPVDPRQQQAVDPRFQQPNQRQQLDSRNAHPRMQDPRFQQPMQDQRYAPPQDARRSLNEVPNRGPVVGTRGFQSDMNPYAQQPQAPSGPQLLREVPRENDNRRVLTDFNPRWEPQKLENTEDEYTRRWSMILAKLEGRNLRSQPFERMGCLGGEIRNPHAALFNTALANKERIVVKEDMSLQNAPVPRSQRDYREVMAEQVNFGGYKIDRY